MCRSFRSRSIDESVGLSRCSEGSALVLVQTLSMEERLDNDSGAQKVTIANYSNLQEPGQVKIKSLL